MLRVGQILEGALFKEPMRVAPVQPRGPGAWLVGLVGLRSERFRRVNLNAADLKSLKVLDTVPIYDGDGKLLRLGLRAYSLGIARTSSTHILVCPSLEWTHSPTS